MDINYNIIEKGNIDMPVTDDEGEKIFYQLERVELLFSKYNIVEILCEDQYGGLNIDTLKKLTRVVGAFLYIAKKHQIPISTIYPTSWRKLFHGSGKAKKKDTFDKVVTLYDIEDFKFSKHNDITDAVGIAWSLVDMVKERRLKEASAA